MNGIYPTSKRAKISKETPESFLKDDPLLKTMTFSEEDPGVVIQYCADAVIHAGLVLPGSPVPKVHILLLQLLHGSGLVVW